MRDQALREEEGVFRTLMNEFGSSSTEVEAPEEAEEAPTKAKTPKTPGGGGGKLLLDEEREIGAVSWRVYSKYGAAMGSWSWVGLCAAFLCFTQAANVGNSLFLGFWTGSEIGGFRQGDYMAIYACGYPSLPPSEHLFRQCVCFQADAHLSSWCGAAVFTVIYCPL